jgi:hypothetical protein
MDGVFGTKDTYFDRTDCFVRNNKNLFYWVEYLFIFIKKIGLRTNLENLIA